MTSLCLVVLQPFTLRRLPYSDDGLLHLYRVAAIEHSLRVDHPLWPRFSSGLVYGYGAPLLNFFPPLAYYPASLAHRLGVNVLDAWLLAMSAYSVLVGAGMYALGRLWTRSALGGWIAAAAYVYSPYLLYDSISRGATAELAALAALPYVLYGVARLGFAGSRSDFIIVLASLTVFIPLHTVITLHGAVLLVLYGFFLVWRAEDGRAALMRLTLAGTLTLMLTAFYWLPALTELDTIKLPLIAKQLGHIDAARHLQPLAELFALPPTADPTQQNQALPLSLGWPQLFLSAIAFSLGLRARHRQFFPVVAALWLVLICLVFLNTPAAAWIWQNLPLIGFTQFPWRTLGLASIMLALLSAIGVRLLWLHFCGRWLAIGIVAVAAALLILYALPWVYTLYRSDVAVHDIRDVQRLERERGQLALSSYGEYLPVSAYASELDARRLIARFEEHDVIRRLLPSPTVKILEQAWQGTAAALRLALSEAQTLEFDWLFVPGWSASIDGVPAEVYPSAGVGLVALEAPAGEFELRLALDATPAQSLAGALSIIGLAAAILSAWRWRHRPLTPSLLHTSDEDGRRWSLLFVAVGIAVFFLKALALDATDTPIKQSRFGAVMDAPALANFGHKFDLLAVDLPAGEITQPIVTIKLYWRLHGDLTADDYSSMVRMLDPQGIVVAEAGAFAPGGLATSNWLRGAYIEDVIELSVPPFTARLPEAYAFDLSLYDSQSLRRLSVMNAAGDPQDAKFRIAELPLRWTGSASTAQSLTNLGDGRASLYEAPQLPGEATAGDTVEFSWVWQKLREAGSNVWVRLLWLDAHGAEVAAGSALPLVHGYDFAAWEVGEVNRGHHTLIVPARLPAGSYVMAMHLLHAANQLEADVIHLDQVMRVTAPVHQFEPPPVSIESSAEWVNGIVLHGFSLSVPGEVELIWGTTRPLSQSLRLFVHALDADGRIAGQWDGVPVDWTRPTTGWIEGEYLITNHGLTLPAGEYRLRLGWYVPATGSRILVAGADALELDPKLVIP